MKSLTWNQVNTWRVQQHHLHTPADRRHMLDVAAQICGAQAQVMSAAEIMLGVRVAGISPEDVQQALWSDRTLIKTWAMRGTLHLLSAADFPIYVAALSTLDHYRKGAWLKYFGLSLQELDLILDGFQSVLNDSGLTREQLADAIAAHANKPHLRERMLSGWGSLLIPAAFQGFLCYGPSEGQNVTFVSPEKWIGAWQPLESDAALKEIARKFLTAYGPATPAEFSRWLGITTAQAKRVFKGLGDEIAAVSVDGWEAFALATMLDQIDTLEKVESVRLLPYFDPYTIAVAKHSHFLMPEEFKTQVYRSGGWIYPVVLVDGRIAGIWSHDRQKTNVTVTVEMFAMPSHAIKKRLKTEAQRLGEFFNSDTVLQLSP